MLRHTDSSIYINFTSGKNLEKPVKQILEVKNEFRELNVTVFIRVPVKLGDENIWTTKNVQNCSVAVCAVFRCDVNLMRNERKFYNISGNVSSGWIEQIGIRSASFQLVSTASLDYDEDKYIYFSDSLSSVPVCEHEIFIVLVRVKVNTQVEVYEEQSILKEVIVGVIGGLLIISLITAVLLKICGPTIPKKCVAAINYRGMCFIYENNEFKPPIPSPKYRDCLGQIDIAFLLDGSGSVRLENFVTMKAFVTNVIKRFTERDAQFAIAQYSSHCVIHYKFTELNIQDAWESKVGSAFVHESAKQELNDIAPDIGHVFRVTDFDALNNILQKLEENIIAIEGTQTSGDSSRMEFAQDGFSTAFTSTVNKYTESLILNSSDQGSVLLSAVGAFQWKGGYEEYFPNGSFQTGNEHESYLDLAANINYTIVLDAKRQKYRAYFTIKNRLHNDVMNITLQEACRNHAFLIEACPEDALNPLSNELTFTFEGLPSTSRTMQNLRPVLLPEIKTTTDHNLDFEINCGTDNSCVDDLRMDFNFSGSTNIEVGIMQEINVTVFVENRGENSYNTLFILSYPFGLSYRRITSKQVKPDTKGRVECVSLDGVQGVKLGETNCYISKPILKDNSQVVFEITYSINKDSTLGQNVNFKAEVKSGNDNHSSNSEFFKEKAIGVKYAVYIALIRLVLCFMFLYE
ncbi:integrin alpha-M-like protein [Labeo rohita]|uniref:Integrin alpha-M-like protein n=1 Tax=Labeo rohita TaxID=84645 RepID=A0A498N1W4_LABRO|nr:integrin alpha-M-like protein [Labeo rohita]